MPSVPLEKYGMMARAAGSVFTVDQKHVDGFWKFIYDRHLIWYKRFVLKQEAPWTKDPCMLEYKFTNVYRELDRGTIYLLDNIIGNKDLTPLEQVFNIIFYRMFNRIETYEAAGPQHLVNSAKTPGALVWANRKSTWEKLDGLYATDKPLWTDAHMVCAYEHFPGDNKFERFQYIFKQVMKALPDLWEIVKTAKSLGTIHKALTAIPGIGPFNAYEIEVDISYAPWNNLSEDEWVNPGPGCQRGLKALFPGIKPNECTQVIHVLRQVQVEEFTRMKLPFFEIAYQGKELTLRNIEHCLCEYFKIVKAREGTGRPRNKFKAKAMPGQADFKRLKG